jgi:uncharacterized damage-inducible protein DinB
MSQESDRFLVMYEELVLVTNDWMLTMPKEKLEWAPVDNPNVRFGDRLTTVNIKGLYKHITLNDHYWVRMIRDAENNAVFQRPDIPDIAEAMDGENFIEDAIRLHGENIDVLRSFGKPELTKKVVHTRRTYTGMGFLWAMYAHRSYHLGNIDIYIRQADVKAPDFFNFHREVMA